MVEGEFGNQFVHRHYLGVVAGIPSQEGEEVHYGFWEVALLAVTGRDGSGDGVFPFKEEYGETEAVAVAFG